LRLTRAHDHHRHIIPCGAAGAPVIREREHAREDLVRAALRVEAVADRFLAGLAVLPELTVRHRNSIRVRTETEAARDLTMSTLLVDARPANPWGIVVTARESAKRRASVPFAVH